MADKYMPRAKNPFGNPRKVATPPPKIPLIVGKFERKVPAKTSNDHQKRSAPANANTTFIALIKEYRASGLNKRESIRAANRQLHAMRDNRMAETYRVDPVV